LLNKVQPKLYQFLQAHRFKQEASDLLQLGRFKPVVHVSSKYSARNNCLAIVLPICKHPTNANGIIVYDLSYDPEPLLSLSAEEIKYRLYTPSKDLLDGETRVPLKTVHTNKCPVLAPINVIRTEDACRLALDLDLCYARIAIIKAAIGLSEKITAVFGFPDNATESVDPDLAIYRGGFFTDADKQKMAKIRASTPDQLALSKFNFTDARLAEMLFRYRARNYPETLSQAEATQWREFCVNRLTGKVKGAGITLANYFARLAALKTENANIELICALEDYARDKMQQLNMG
jgi:exodeoxyribonuclease-1